MKHLLSILFAAAAIATAMATTVSAQTQNIQLPVSGNPEITYGEAVSRHEFGIDTGIFRSPDGSLLAVYKKDESRVTNFPLLDISTRTGSLISIKYPMNGMASEHISLCICDTLGNIRCEIVPTEFTEERYLTQVCWSPDSRYIFIQVLSRTQHDMHLNMYRASDGSFVRTLLTEHNDAWTEPQDILRPIPGSADYIYTTDNRDGYRSLYRIDTLGNIKRLTCVDADVEFAATDGRRLYYTSAEVSPIENHLFCLDLRKPSRRAVRLTPESGWHSITVAEDCRSFEDKWSSLDEPATTVRRSTADGSILEVIKPASEKLKGKARPEISLSSFKSADGAFDNYYRFVKPMNFDPSKKYPLVVYVYGGPHSQMVQNAWNGRMRKIEELLSAKGIACFSIDGRGTDNRGAAYEKAINRQCGKVEMEDQIAALKALLTENPWIDASRVGVAGWSYGGFMTISLITHYPGYFKAAACGGPVIDWKWYEVMYGERYMDTPETNPEGFASTTLMGRAGDVKCPLLICQGMIDDTVLPINSLSFTQECVEKGVQLDYFPYPRSEHNVKGAWRQHLYDKFVEFLTGNL